jgi:hypothetical protein
MRESYESVTEQGPHGVVQTRFYRVLGEDKEEVSKEYVEKQWEKTFRDLAVSMFDAQERFEIVTGRVAMTMLAVGPTGVPSQTVVTSKTIKDSPQLMEILEKAHIAVMYGVGTAFAGKQVARQVAAVRTPLRITRINCGSTAART